MILVEVSQKMTGLTKENYLYKASRILSAALSLLAGAVFLFAAYSGYHTWRQDFLISEDIGLEGILAAVEAIILLPGLAPFLAALYFFVLLKEPIYNLLGLFVTIVAAFFHVVVSVPAVHSGVFVALAISISELIAVLICIWLFNKFVVTNKK